MQRRSYTLALEIVPTAPLTHGSGSAGNEQVLMTREVLVPREDGTGYERVEIPAVSGSSFKAVLREQAVHDALERAGVEAGTLGKDPLRLLLKGGRTDSGGQSVPLEQARQLRDLFPLLAVFGSMDGGLPIRGAIQVSDVLPFCAELEAAGVLTRSVVPLHVEREGVEPPKGIRLYPDAPLALAHQVRTQVTYYRHDMRSSGASQFLEGAVVRQIEDARVARHETGSAKKAERREANESMPHSYQAIVPGAPMYAVIRVRSVTEAEWGCVCAALTRWIASGGHLGGGATKGHGACSVRVAGALAHHLASGVQPSEPGTSVDVGGTTPEGRAYAAYTAHLDDRREQIREYLLGAA